MKLPFIPDFGISLGCSDRLFLIAGPCVIESRQHTLFMADALKTIAVSRNIPFIFKASFDKANRSSIHSYRGPGVDEGLNILKEVRATIGVPVLSDIHEASQAERAGMVLDIIQIPAFLCRQTDLLTAAAGTGKIVNVKKGQFVSPAEMENVVSKIHEAGNDNIILTERGSTFGYNNLVVDFRSIPIMRTFGYPVVFDATHSVQLPGAAKDKSGGQPEFIPTLASAGVAAGADGIFMEVHDNPSHALSDGANALHLDELPKLIDRLIRIKNASA